MATIVADNVVDDELKDVDRGNGSKLAGQGSQSEGICLLTNVF
jgi:hypothetical protein